MRRLQFDVLALITLARLHRYGCFLLLFMITQATQAGDVRLPSSRHDADAPTVVEYLRVQFTRSLYPPSSPPEIVKGNIYFTPEGAMYLEVTSPVSQLIALTGKQMSIYYPKERKAFVIEAANPLQLPFASAFLGSMRESMGLAELGFTTSSVTRRGDTIVSTWAPPLSAKSALSKVVLFETGGAVVLSESFDPKGLLTARALFKNHVAIKQGRVPLEISGGWQTSKGWTKENLEFTSPEVIVSLPEHLNNFTIPGDVVPRRVQW